VTGGGSDVNAFAAKGFRCLNVANGTEANHTPDERVSEWALDTMLAVTRRLLVRAAEV
jgi:di/tripeptidase